VGTRPVPRKEVHNVPGPTPHYPPEYKREAVQLYRSSEKSIPKMAKELGMGKSWIYRRLRSGEIPSVRLGRTIKVRQDELEEYLQRHHYPAVEEEPEEKSS
jgi:excisionase family DNA binding protein